MEKLDVYSTSRQRTGKIISRGDPVAEGERLLIVHLCLFSSANEMLIQQRSFGKDRYPGCWDVSAGGFVRSGESAGTAVLREAAGELGIRLTEKGLLFVRTEPFSYVLDDFYLAIAELDPSALSIQSSELEAVQWASRDEVMRKLASGEFVDYPKSLIDLMYAAAREAACERQRKGAFINGVK